jgi:hypothetical protein
VGWINIVKSILGNFFNLKWFLNHRILFNYFVTMDFTNSWSHPTKSLLSFSLGVHTLCAGVMCVWCMSNTCHGSVCIAFDWQVINFLVTDLNNRPNELSVMFVEEQSREKMLSAARWERGNEEKYFTFEMLPSPSN